MDELEFNRRLPASVRGRWGRLFWILPVLSLLWVLLDHKDRLMAKEARATFLVGPFGSPAVITASTVFDGREPLVRVFQRFALFSSPELLAAAATELGLPTRWGVGTDEAAARLGSDVTCEAQRYTRLVHLKVVNVSGVDELKACEAILAQGTKPAAFRFIARVERELSMKKQDFELLDRAGGWTTAWQELRTEVAVLEAQLEFARAHVSGTSHIKIHTPPHRMPIDWAMRLKWLGIDAALAFGGSMTLAFLLAHLLERCFPRRRPPTKECLPA